MFRDHLPVYQQAIETQGVPEQNQVQCDVISDLGSNIVKGDKEDGGLYGLQTGSVTGRH